MNKVDLGCGPIYKEGFERVDNNPDFNPNRIIDLDEENWALHSDHYDYIYSCHVIEHLSSLESFLKEVYRIAKDQCFFEFHIPHLNKGWSIQEHKHVYGVKMLQAFERFHLYKRSLKWNINPTANPLIKFFDKLITPISNINVDVTERLFSYTFGGYDEVMFYGIIFKNPDLRWRLTQSSALE